MSRLRIFTGHFGSGKTETALNYAIRLAEEDHRVCVVDLDIVNPYFCSRDVRNVLMSKDIRLISAAPSLANAELLVISPEVYSVFNDKRYEAVIDVGGDDLGAVALGQYQRYFKNEAYDMFFVINAHRPLSADRAAVINYIERIENASRLKVTHLVANTNMSFETTVDDVLMGDEFVAQLSCELNLPHAMTVCRTDLARQLQGRTQGSLFAIEIFMKTPWM